MQYASILLSNASSAPAAGVQYSGGRTVLSIIGTLATTTKLQMLGPDSSTWFDLATISAAGATVYDLAPGQYRITLTSGSPSGIYASLIKVPYN